MPTIAVTSMKGGVGKTTVTLGLASAAWKRGLRVLVIDLDPQSNATMGLNSPTPRFTINDVLADARPGIAAEAVLETGWGPNVHVIASDRALEHRNVAEGKYSSLRLRASLATLPRQYDLVLIDCPPSLGELTRNALSAANKAVIVTEPGYFSLHGAAQAVEAVEVIRGATNPTLSTATILVNRARTTVADHRMRIQELREAYGPLVSAIMVPERNAIPQSEGAGIPIHAWDSPAGRELSGIFDTLYDQLTQPPGRILKESLS
jgi:chromosome partitioning protein